MGLCSVPSSFPLPFLPLRTFPCSTMAPSLKNYLSITAPSWLSMGCSVIICSSMVLFMVCGGTACFTGLKEALLWCLETFCLPSSLMLFAELFLSLFFLSPLCCFVFLPFPNPYSFRCHHLGCWPSCVQHGATQPLLTEEPCSLLTTPMYAHPVHQVFSQTVQTVSESKGNFLRIVLKTFSS